MSTIVRGVQPAELDEIWPRVVLLIDRALRHCGGDYSIKDVRESLETKRRQLFVTWPEPAAAGVTEIDERPGGKVLNIFALAGRLPADWRAILTNLEQWAADQGCHAVELRGRRGWARMLRGYEAKILMRKELRP